jgi:transposase
MMRIITGGDNMKPISCEIRELIIEAKQRGEKEEKIAVWLKISKRSVGTIWKLFKDTGKIEPTKYMGRKSRLSNEKTNEVHAMLKENPDITLNELIERLLLPIKKSQLSKLLIKLGFSYKKRLFIRKSSLGRMFNKNALDGRNNRREWT